MVFLACNERAADNEFTPVLADLMDGFQKNAIDRIDVIHVPDRIRFRYIVGPEGLEKSFQQELTMSHLDTSSEPVVSLANSLYQLHAVADVRHEVRWRVAFIRVDGVKLSVYFSADGRSGYINNAPVHFEGTLFQKVIDLFPARLR